MSADLASGAKVNVRSKRTATQPTLKELSELGHVPTPMLKLVRASCFSCSNSSESIRLCPMRKCEWWPYRFGKNPFKKRKKASAAQTASLSKGRMKNQEIILASTKSEFIQPPTSSSRIAGEERK